MPVWAAPRVGLLLFVICAVALGFSTPWLGPSSWDSPFVDPTLSRSLLNHRPDTASAARNHHQVPEHHEPATDGLPTGAGQVPHTSTSTNRTRSFSHPVGGAGGDGDIHAQLLSSTPPRPAFDHVYVVSLPSRQDRRDQMRQIAAALQLNITFIDATLSSDPKITWIAEHVYDVRQQKAKHLLSTARGKSRADQQEPEVGGMGVGSVWLAMDGQRSRRGKTLHLPPIPNWVAALYEAVDADRQLHPQDPHFDVTAHLRDPIERIESRQLNAAVLSTWFSHVEAWRLMQRNADKAALFLEDDIDMEWDFAARWASIDSKLPPDWHSVFAGHCWGREMTFPTGLHPHLFHANIPRCLHGYVLSQSGVSKLLPYTRDPWTAFQAPIDVLIPTLLLSQPLNVYSIDPPLVIQAKDLDSDIQPGKGSKWRGRLADSTLDRIWRDQGKQVQQVPWEVEWETDPAVNRPHKDGQSW